MDEAHALKDKNSYRWKNLMSVARSANQRLMLTGTPLQNDLHVSLVTLYIYEILLIYLSSHIVSFYACYLYMDCSLLLDLTYYLTNRVLL